MKLSLFHYFIFSFLLMACSSGDDGVTEEPQQQDDGRTRVSITTRTEEGTMDGQMQAGLFMVNYVDRQPDELLPDHNYVNNQLLTWTGSGWTTDMPIYWNDMETPADFYAYAPYQATVEDARRMAFSIATDQRSDEAFARSDLMWGCIRGQHPTAEGFDLTLTHQLSRLTVVVTAEAGFEEGELQAKDVTVSIGGTRPEAIVDLSTGMVSVVAGADGNSGATVMCHSNGDLSYTAVLIPQDVPFSNLIQVDWRGNKYTLQNSFRFEPKRQYTITVKLKKTQSGFDIGITGWDIIDEDFGGVIGGN